MNLLIGYMNKNLSGINIYLRNFIENIDRTNYKIIVITRNYDEELAGYLKKYDCKLISIHHNRNFVKAYSDVSNAIKQNKIDVCYFNISESFDCIGILSALENKVGKIIVHSHSKSVFSNNKIIIFIKYILNSIFKKVTSSRKIVHLACSHEAAQWLYSKKIIKNRQYNIINNAIDCQKFIFNQTEREKIRKEYSIKDDEYIIGHVGGYRKQKNQDFLIKLLEYLNNNSTKNYKLMLIGDYNNADSFLEEIKRLNLYDKIIIVSETPNVNDFYNSMDIFIFPSLFEGFGIVGIEAQANGLPCIFSSNVPKATKITDLVEYISLDSNFEIWKNKIEELLEKNARKENDYYKEVIEKGFDLKTEVIKFQKKYLDGEINE